MSNTTYYYRLETPVGPLTACVDSGALCGLSLPSKTPDLSQAINCDFPKIVEDLQLQLSEYFSGSRQQFDLPLRMRGSTFQTRVWRSLQEVPYGSTISYLELAEAVGSPRASRAVGLANRCNPLPIIVPCHRVIGKNGKLVGYAGGLALKQTLLELEGAFLQ